MIMSDEDGVGYGQPPRSSRYPTGTSGNPAGRPKRKGMPLPFENVFGRIVTVRDGDGMRSVSAEEALVMYIKQRALNGNDAANAALETITQFKEKRYPKAIEDEGKPIVLGAWTEGSPNMGLLTMRMVTKLYPLEQHARILIEPWLVTAALQRLGERRLTIEEQKVVVAATRKPKKVSWPDWWEERP
jgi:hypothetical protein